ncbi:MAG: GldG family protein [Acidobacteria bacterium]|nr:GldG family protein [Acidobacteriota bacterium]
MVKRLVGILGWLGTALVFAAVAVRFLKPELQQVWNALALAGLACVLLYILGQWRDILRVFGGRQARFGALTSASVLIVIGILVALNYVAARQNKRWDVTASKQFSLSEQTTKVLQNLKAPLKVTVFAREAGGPGENTTARFRDVLDSYQYYAKNLSVEYLDPDKKPAVARQYQIQTYGTAVFEYQTRTERVTSTSEQDLTNALIKVVQGQQKKVYFTQGHGEKDPTSADQREGYNGIGSALGGDNFGVEKLVLAQQHETPSDASVVVIAGPKTDFFPSEVDSLRAYMRTGGKVLMLLDPPERGDSAPLTNLVALLKDWDIELGNNVVVDVSGLGQLIGTDASVPVAANYPAHAITDRFNLLSAYPLARSVTIKSGGTSGRSPQTFIETSSRSWAESDIQKLLTTGQVKLDENAGDKKGPVSIAAAVSVAAEQPPAMPAGSDAKKPETRLAVIGDSDFAANSMLGIRGNRDIFLNTVSWLAQQENLIAIRPREPEDRRITLTADQQRRIFWLSVFIIPGLVLGTGIYAWWRRR